MEPLEAIVVLVAAVGAGALNAVVGAGTLVTFPLLLALGIPPVLANVSSKVGLAPGAIAASYAYRSTLVGSGRLVVKLAVASTTGSVLGAVLLLALPPGAFELVVPPLLLLAGVLSAIQPRVAAWVARRRATRAAASDAADADTAGPASDPTSDAADADTAGPANDPASDAADADTAGPAATSLRQVGWILPVGVFVTGVYGGYFGAAQGVILLAILGVFVGGAMNEVNGIKNVLAAVVNLVSAALFMVTTEVDWTVAALVAVGSTIGGGLGGRYGRRLPSSVLRGLVVVVAVAAAAWQLAT